MKKQVLMVVNSDSKEVELLVEMVNVIDLFVPASEDLGDFKLTYKDEEGEKEITGDLYEIRIAFVDMSNGVDYVKTSVTISLWEQENKELLDQINSGKLPSESMKRSYLEWIEENNETIAELKASLNK